MRNLFLTSTLFLLSTIAAYSQNFWQQAGLDTLYVNEIIACEGDSVYGVSNSDIYISNNKGANWSYLSQIDSLEIRELIRGNNTNLYACGFYSKGIYISTDKGENWKTKNIGLTDLNIEDIFIAANGELFAISYKTIYKSYDEGENWNVLYNLPDTSSGIEFIVVNDDGVIFCGGDLGVLIRSNDNGITWHSIKNGLAADYFSDLTIGANNFIFLGVDDFGIYRSTNLGDSWELQNNSGKFYDVRSLYGNNKGIIAAGTGVNNFEGVVLSTDNGETWEEKKSGMNTLSIFDISMDGDGFIYAGTSGRGVYKSVNNITDVKREEETNLSFQLFQNYPNPFNPSTKINWRADKEAWQSLKVYDVLGNEVAVLVDGLRPAGNFEASFNTNEEGKNMSPLPSGIYFYRLTVYSDQIKSGANTQTKKMILCK